MLRTVSVRYLVLAFLLLLVLNGVLYHALFKSPMTSVSVAHVGEGTVALIREPHTGIVLINAGSDASILRVLGLTLLPWKRRLTALILTDGSSTHAGGAPEVLSRYEVQNLIRFGMPGPKSAEEALSLSLKTMETPQVLKKSYGEAVLLGNLVLQVVSPDTTLITSQSKTLVVSSTTSVGVYLFP